MAPYSDTPDGLFRGYLTPAYAAAQEAVAGWMIEAGMTVSIDAAANLIGRYEGGPGFAAPPLLIGSHIDSVRDAGRYDGPLGVMLGIEAVAALNAAGRRPDFPIEVIAFGDEEGSRFPAAMLTSRAVAGTLDPAALAVADRDGVTLHEALAAYRRLVAGWQSKREEEPAFGGIADFGSARRAAPLAYLEVHIEQGPVLDAEGLALGVVTGIAAQLRYQVGVVGVAGHAGTTTMALRRDALAAAAEAVLMVERVARSGAGDLVATVGRLLAVPGAANVIPGRVDFTIDIRSGDQGVRDAAATAILAELDAIAARRCISISAERVQNLAASACDPGLTDRLAEAVAAEGLPVRRLVSGAGHDAMVMAALCPTAMLFIRCVAGISHNPDEHVDPADADAALQAMLGFIDRLGEAV
ncbi:allantoate amidohydrolase [Sphingomonas oligophenolica]|uniref:Allantoate amidohydrolase n=1 Tax=Sphingomonas oligophenolica TaxID=301154 RepID=A0ABU9Y5V1_9SPHN